MIDFTNDQELIDYIGLVDDNKDPLRHTNYDYNIHHASEMAVHIKGNSPEDILIKARPNEPSEVFEERMRVFEPVTKSYAKKVLNVLAKIRSNSNFTIGFKEQSNKITEGTGLREYTDKLPFYDSIKDRLFDVMLKQDMADPNSLITISPIEMTADDSEMFEPIPVVYGSELVVDYIDNHYYTILLDEKSLIKKGNIKTQTGSIFLIYAKNEIIKVIQVSENKGIKSYSINRLFKFDFKIPAFFAKGDPLDGSIPLNYESFIAGVLPHWNKVIRLDSDLDAQYITHMYLERVEIEVECDNGCHKEDGVNITRTKGGECVTCNRCKGSGFINGRSPYGVTVVKKDALDNSALEFPGVTYVDKPTDIVELAEKKVALEISRGLESINMDIVVNVGENQSGIAKSIDRSDLNSFLLKVSDNMFTILGKTYHFINLWRYSTILNEKELKENEPIINKPTEFNVLSSLMLSQEISNMKDLVSDETTEVLELDLIDKKFANDTAKRDYLRAVRELDPMQRKEEAEKLMIITGGGNTKIQYIISSNMKPFILRAIEEDDTFLQKPHSDKMAKLIEYANQLQASNGVIPIVDENGVVSGEEIDTPIDIEAAAKAKLKGTVGGVQGIIQINQAVATGQMSEGSAELLLREIYGFNDEIAGALIEVNKDVITKEN